MTRTMIRRLNRTDASSIHADLTQRQFLAPRKRLADVLTEVAAAQGLTLTATARAVEQLGLDPTVSVGRLTRDQLESLARSVRRAWRCEMSLR